MGDDAHTADRTAAPTDRAAKQEEGGWEGTTAEVDLVHRSTEIEAPVDDVWEAISDPDRRPAWLDDDDALSRVTRIDRVDPGRCLSWTWWHPDDADTVTQVEVTLDEPMTGTTRVTVVERRPNGAARTGGLTVQASASASASAAIGTVSAHPATARAWDYRLLGLALLFVVAGVRIQDGRRA